MNKDAIVFALANPIPEIWPWEAEEAGAKIVATGRGDFPNQVNNSLGFSAIFREVLTVRTNKMTQEMFIAAAKSVPLCQDTGSPMFLSELEQNSLMWTLFTTH